MSKEQEHRDIINQYADRISEAMTHDDIRSIAMALLAHMSYLLGREDARAEMEGIGEEDDNSGM